MKKRFYLWGPGGIIELLVILGMYWIIWKLAQKDPAAMIATVFAMGAVTVCAPRWGK